ncbi:response regulator [Sphingomonas sp. M1A8_2b]
MDDDALVRVHSFLALEDAGFEVIEAEDAAEALAHLEVRSDISAMLTDVRMPGDLDGVGLASKVRSERPGISILVTSGTDDVAALDLPKDIRFVRKPYTGIQLLNMLTMVHPQPVHADLSA